MPDLNFSVTGAAAVPFAAAPTLDFSLNVGNASPKPIHTIVLRTQIRIEPQRRTYDESSQKKLGDLFGEPSRWGQTLRPLLWTHVTSTVSAFTEKTTAQLSVPCSFDFNLAATKYFHGLPDGDIPLLFLFSGTVFYATDDHSLQVTQIPWENESRFRLPVAVWRQMMDHYYPNGSYLHLHRDAFGRLHEYKISRGLPTWEAAIESLLAEQQVKA